MSTSDEEEDQPTVYVHPETGEEVEIPEGARITYLGKGKDREIAAWSNPPATPEGELHPDQVEDYEPNFDRASVQRRVLGHITDENHVGRGPRNTADRLSQELDEDPNSSFVADEDDMQAILDELEDAGLVAARDDGTYEVTEPGRIELAN
jgi:hypothetical protein